MREGRFMAWRWRFAGLPVWVLGAFALLFLYLPIAVVILYSFNGDSIMTYPMRGFTFDWYQALFENRQVQLSLRNSAIVAFSSIAIGLLIGIPGAFALDRYHFPGKRVFEIMLLMPFVMPGVLFGIALLVLYINLGLQLSLLTVVLGHATLMIVVVIFVVSVGLKRWDRTIEQAAMDLGANGLETFFFVTLPNLRASIVGAVLLGLTLSLDEIIRTFFWTGIDNTLPLHIWAMFRLGVTPEINALATLIFIVSALGVVAWVRLTKV